MSEAVGLSEITRFVGTVVRYHVGIFYYVTNEIKSFQWAWTKIYHLLVFFDTDMLKSILQQVVLISEHS